MDSWFSADGLMPHGHCYLWYPPLVALHVVTDLLSALAYGTFAFILIRLHRRVRHLPFHLLYLSFAFTITACGVSHLMEIYTLWVPAYWLSGLVKVVTALSAVATVILLPPLVPQILELVDQAWVNHENKRFRQLADAIPQMVWTALPDGRADYVNDRWIRYTGVLPKRGKVLDWGLLVHPEDVAASAACWQTALRSGNGFELETRLRRAEDGAYRWQLIRGIPVRDAKGRIAMWFGTCTDIDAQKRAEAELQQAIQMRDDFLSVASHELKTPLTSLHLQFQSIQRRQRFQKEAVVPAWLQEKLEIAEGQAIRMGWLIVGMLDVARHVERGKPSFGPVDLADVVSETLLRFVTDLERAGSPLERHLPAGIVGQWDRLQIEQIANNLISNAIKYGEGKAIRIAIGTDDRMVYLEVTDHGAGVAPADQDRIFARYARSVATRHLGGFGLGLWIVKETLDRMGGTITVESTPGAGATFRARWPSMPADVTVQAEEGQRGHGEGVGRG